MPQPPAPHRDPEATQAAPPPIALARIFAVFLKLGCTSFGGGMAGWLHRDMVLKRRWIDDEAFLAMLAVAQITPGSNGVKLTALIGQRLRGAAGATVALAGLLGGPFAIVLVIAAVYAGIGRHPIVYRMLGGVAAAVVGLTLATGLHSLKHGARGPAGIAIAAATVVSVGFLGWPILPVVAVLAPLSIALAFVELRRR
ncbi:MAG TPA: chromate transporter [Stellaceae bacterium]|nr:chromate transporter [Stellaceae bacterium]